MADLRQFARSMSRPAPATSERQREQARQWKRDNPDRVRELRRDWKTKNPDKVKADKERYRAAGGKLRENHRMRVEDWSAMFAAQGGCCYLCGDLLPAERRNVHVDHDHGCCPSGKSCPFCRRGLACSPCNLLIGQARDDPERLRRIASNLECAQEGVRQRQLSKPAQDVLL